jgi:hypothetical protein
MNILSIDPGDVESAYVVWNGEIIIDKGIVPSDRILTPGGLRVDLVTIEMLACQGQKVGATVFDTLVWVGRYIERCHSQNLKVRLVYRYQVKSYFGVKNDAGVIKALTERLGGKGTKKTPGRLYGVHEDEWQALALAVMSFDKFGNSNLEKIITS